MKTFLIAGVLLALGLTTGLGLAHGLKETPLDSPTACWVSPPGSQLWYECGSKDAQDALCLSLLEGAMRSVDPFVADPAKTTTPEEASAIKRKWDRAKTECWPEIRDSQPKHFH